MLKQLTYNSNYKNSIVKTTLIQVSVTHFVVRTANVCSTHVEIVQLTICSGNKLCQNDKSFFAV